jgi:hypothetical protein
MCSPGFSLVEDEKRAVRWLAAQKGFADEQKADWLRLALEFKHSQVLKNNCEREFLLPRGLACFYYAMDAVSRLIPEFRILRNSGISAFKRMCVFELGHQPTLKNVWWALNSYAPISIREFVDDVATGNDFRYLVLGKLNYTDWAVFWSKLAAANIVRSSRTNGLWQTFTCYFIGNRFLPYGLENAGNVRKAVSRFTSNGLDYLPNVSGDKSKRFRDVLELLTQIYVAAPPSSNIVRVDECVKRYAAGSGHLFGVQRSETVYPTLPRFVNVLGFGRCSACDSDDVILCPKGCGVIEKEGYDWSRPEAREPLCEWCFDDFVDSEVLRFHRIQESKRWRGLSTHLPANAP